MYAQINNNLSGDNHLIVLEGNEDLLGAGNLTQYLQSEIKRRGLKIDKNKYAKIVKAVSKGYEKKIVNSAKTTLKGFIEETNGLNGLLGSEDIEELTGDMEYEELLGYSIAMDKPGKVNELVQLFGDLEINTIDNYRDVLKGYLVDELELLGSNEFDSMDNIELLGFLKKLFKGVGKFVKGVGKGIGKVAKGIGKGVGKVAKFVGKGIGQVGKGVFNVIKAGVKTIGKGIKGIGQFIGKNWKNLLTIPLALIPGGSIITGLVDSILNQEQAVQEQQPEQYTQQQEEYFPQEQYTQQQEEYLPQQQYTDDYNYEPGYNTDDYSYEPEYNTDDYNYEPEYSTDDYYYEPEYSEELLGSFKNFLKDVGKFGKNLVSKVQTLVKNNPSLMLSIAGMTPQQKYNYAMKLNAEVQSEMKKDAIDKQSNILYTTEYGKQSAGLFTGEIFNQLGIPLLIIAGIYLMSNNNKKK